ncbi:MAG: LAGLIDADG family homing endonuclease, partial [Candidatus Omnitrophota bacterium]
QGCLSERPWERQLNFTNKLLFNFFKQLGAGRLRAHEKELPKSIFEAPREAVVGFLKGLFSSDGTVNFIEGKSAYVRLSSASLKLLKQTQLLLLNLGVFSRIYENRKGEKVVSFPCHNKNKDTKKYKTRPYHELEISREDVITFLEEVGFIGDKHAKKTRLLLRKAGRERGYYKRERHDLVVGLEAAGTERVYDLTEPVSHSFIANGCVVHNCGEQVLLPYESCNLGSINLSKMVYDGKVDLEHLKEVVRTAVHFLDNVIDMNRYPIKKIEEMTKSNRKIGLGVMGFADMLIRLGVPYNSEEALVLAEETMRFVIEEAKKASCELAKKRGVFPNFEKSIYNAQNGLRLRNATVTTIAPTGTLSIIAGCSSGIEPLFALAYYRKVMDNDKLAEINKSFERAAKSRGFFSDDLMKKVIEKGSLHDISEIPEDVKSVFVTSHDISPEWHIRMQAAFQKFTHNAVSKTINFPQEATLKDVEKTYMLSYKLGCKGITIYRDRSRDEQVLNIDRKTPEPAKEVSRAPQKITPKPRPAVITGTTTKVGTGCGNLYVTINVDENGSPFEAFTQMGKAGGCAASQLEAVARLVSLAMRSGIEISSIVEQLRGIRCPSPSWEKGGRIFSCSDAIARAVEQRYKEEWKLESRPPSDSNKADNTGADAKKTKASASDSKIIKKKANNVVGVCPDCGGALRHEEGCMVCRSCGYSKCG